MSIFFDQIFTLLTTPPGNLVYHIVLVFSIAGTLQGAIQLLHSSQFPQVRRTVLGLGVLLGLQVLLFLVSGLAWQGLLDSKLFLPPLDRLVTTLGLVWITWLWAFPEPGKLADGATALLNLLAIAVFGGTLVFWVQNSAAGFNTSLFETIWQGFSMAVVILGVLVLFVRRPNGWGNGLAMLLLAFVGHLFTLVRPMAGDLPGFVRLTQLALFPILLTLDQRFSTAEPGSPASISARTSSTEHVPERRRYSTDPKTLNALLALAGEDKGDQVARALTRGIAQAMLADLCFLVTMGKDRSLSIDCGYDLIREEFLEGTAINKDVVPLLATAIQRGRPLRLPSSSTSTDLKGLGQMLDLPNPGHLLSVPISSRQRGPVGSILILSPYSNRLWNAEDQAYLTKVSALFLPILERSERASQLESERDAAHQEAHSAQEQATEVAQKYDKTTLQSQLLAESLAAQTALQDESQRTIEALKKQLEQLTAGAGSQGLTGDSTHLESELHQSLEEIARMQNALANANMKILDMEKRPASPITSEQVEVIASISQELRQPMSSIVGYTDLMLGESVGILGALQRKFVERIKASTERIGGLVDDLIQITNLETGKLEFKAETIDLNLIIDNAMAYTSTQIREKNITLRLDIPNETPRIQTDRDALQQMLIHLLQNATTATQSEGVIILRVQIQSEADKHYISIQVTDSGGGIASVDIPRVFARRYRAEHSLIQGLGDTGVGLSIAKALVEAQGGRIWVETEAGSGSTFSILLPILFDAEGEQ